MTVDVEKLKLAGPDKPRKELTGINNECVQCGYCCYDFWCVVGSTLHADKDGPCPELHKDENEIYYCGALLRFKGESLEKIKQVLVFGGGCGSISYESLKIIMEGSFRLYQQPQQKGTK